MKDLVSIDFFVVPTVRFEMEFYHRWRVHRPLGMDSPEHRPLQPPELGEVIEFPDVGDFQRHYQRRAA